MNMRNNWLVIAKLRVAEGDLDGARRARQNANAYEGRHYVPSDGLMREAVAWSDAARRKYAPQTLAKAA